MAAIQVIISAAATPGEASAKIAALGEYISRGHGGRHKPKGRFLGNNYRYSRSRYLPHQGKQECARRVRQGVANG